VRARRIVAAIAAQCPFPGVFRMKALLSFAALMAAAPILVMSGVQAQSAPDAAGRSLADPVRAEAPVSRLGPPPGLAGSYSGLPPLEPLPWQRIFDERGDFVAESRPAQAAGAASVAQASPPPPSPVSAAPAAADGSATVLRIDREAKRVRLRHGPIAKLEMPAMTMLFQVADPALLDQVKEGETVGIRVEQRGQAFVITGWVREGAK
jgi:Cu(I)/Ag(I) efflux system periplasmic protein CusF